ncbi:MAG: DegT/DnrJ/EryC1/StrS family aminotransferase [Sphaerospermopsis kisseleviana]
MGALLCYGDFTHIKINDEYTYKLKQTSTSRHKYAYLSQVFQITDFSPTLMVGLLAPSCTSWHLYVIQLKLDKINKSHKQVFEELRQQGIGVNLHYIPVHLQPYYQQLGFKEGAFLNVENYYKEAISIPLYYGLSLEEQERVVTELAGILL